MKMCQTKTEFMSVLDNELGRYGLSDKNEIIADFEQHFRDSAKVGQSEAEICEKLGDITEIAKQYADIDLPAPAVTLIHESVKVPELVFPDPTVNGSNTAPVSPLVLDEIGDAKEIEEIIRTAPLHPDAPNNNINPEPANVNGNTYSNGNGNNGGAAGFNSQQFQDGINKFTETVQNGIDYVTGAAKTGYDKFKQNNPNMSFNPGGLLACVLIDLFILIWAIPALGGLVIGLCSAALGMLGGGIAEIINSFLRFFDISSVFGHLGFGFFSPIASLFVGVIVLCIGGLLAILSVKAVKGFVKIIIKLINWHAKQIIGKSIIGKNV